MGVGKDKLFSQPTLYPIRRAVRVGLSEYHGYAEAMIQVLTVLGVAGWREQLVWGLVSLSCSIALTNSEVSYLLPYSLSTSSQSWSHSVRLLWVIQ